MIAKGFQNNMKEEKFEIEWGGRKLIVTIGKFANQANGSCTLQYGNTLVLATSVMSKEPREGVNFLPLLVDYEERFYAAGKIKGSRWIKREGRPSDEAIITARSIDRAIRPLFNENIRNDIQVILTVFSFDQKNDPDCLSLIAASIALSISDIPWDGPIAAARIGMINGEWVLNPTYEAREKSDFELIVAGTGNRVVMLEGGAKEVPEEIILGAVKYGQKHLNKIVNFIKEIQKKINPSKNLSVLEDKKTPEKEELEKKVKDYLEKTIPKILFDSPKKTKKERKETINLLKEKLDNYLENEGVGKDKRASASELVEKIVKEKVSQFILDKEIRVDGRKLDEIRPISIEVGLLPHNHGSAMFKRGDTQILSIVTLGAPGEEQYLETMEKIGKKRYFHHYNFPPFSVGEVGPIKAPGRREIGHGALAERAVLPLIPEKEKFPYTIRVVSEVLESNGSSSMGSVCASSMSLMDAGVPIKKQVAGIAMGLVSEEKDGEITRYKILTDIQDLEDSKGGMDFKIAGTKDGITAIQMDTKTKGLTQKIVEETLYLAKKARMQILEKMNQVIATPRPKVSPYAPKIITFKINPEKIRDVIGPSGKVINEIIAQTGVTIEIEESGDVYIASDNEESLEKAKEWIKNITREVKVGEVFQGKVTRILDFGAFVEILPHQEGLVHISELAPFRVKKVEDIVKVGDIIPVKVINIDEQGRINLSLKATQHHQFRQKDKTRPRHHSKFPKKKPFYRKK